MRRARVLVSIALAGCASQPRANRANATTVTAPAQRAWVATGYRELRWDPGWNRPLRESDPARLDSWGPFVAALAASSSQVRAQTQPRVVERDGAEGDRRPSAFEQRFQRLFALGLPDPKGMRFVRGVAASPYARRRRAWYG